ncbi:hypothetical protein HDU91_002750 [Kappamyces sp. JEL0680]|nr:hypothetical protein HDU91_002750 [Kappamyces sp. JEL0680]
MPSAKKKTKTQSSSKSEWVQITDEFGRTRLVRKEEADAMERSFVKASEASNTETSNDYDPDEYPDERGADDLAPHTVKPALPPPKHFDSTREKRHLGVGFYQFDATDEAKRQEQFENIKNIRDDTILSRDKLAISKLKRKEKTNERTRLLQERARARKDAAMVGASASADQFLESLLRQ